MIPTADGAQLEAMSPDMEGISEYQETWVTHMTAVQSA